MRIANSQSRNCVIKVTIIFAFQCHEDCDKFLEKKNFLTFLELVELFKAARRQQKLPWLSPKLTMNKYKGQ